MAIQKITINGKEFKSINAACKFYGIKKSTYIGRRYRGWSIIKSITTKTIAKKEQEPAFVKKIKINGINFKSVKEAAKYFDIPYTIFAHRVRKKFNKKRLLHKGNLESSIASKSIKARISEAIEKLKVLEKKEKIKKTEDWYKISFVKINKIISNVTRKKSITGFEFLTKIYPKKNLLPWKFIGKSKKAPKGTWQIKKFRINYIKWLRNKLKIKRLNGFYSVNYATFYRNYGQGLTHSKDIKSGQRFTILYLFKEAYPNYDWKFWLFDEAPNDVWKDKKNQRAFFDWVLEKEKIKVNTNKIYNLTSAKFKKYKGATTILLYYKNFFECLEKLYPEIKFDRFKFFHKGRGFWQDESNHKIALLYLGDKLGFKKKEDWYTLLHDDFENAGLISLIGASKKYEGSVAKAVCLNLPELKLDPSKFDQSSKYEYRARRFTICLYGLKNVLWNTNPKFLRTNKNKGLELDVFVPSKKLAIEYNGSQHYFFNKHYHNSKKDFLKSKLNDAKKIDLCKKNKINLIVIKYNEWNGFPDTFLNIIRRKHGLSKNVREIFWRRFKKDDLYEDIMAEIKKNKRYTKV